jgi:hypothetical protein
VPGSEIGTQLVEQLAMVWPIREVMVAVEDRQLRIDDGFAGLLRQPGVVRRRDGSSEWGGACWGIGCSRQGGEAV